MNLLRRARNGARVPVFGTPDAGAARGRGRSYADLGVDAGAQAAVGEFLSDLGRRFSGEAADERRVTTLQAAHTSGSDAGLAAGTIAEQMLANDRGDTALSSPTLAFRTDGSEEGDAFNEAAAVAYLSSLDTAMEGYGSRIAQEHATDPDAFRARWDTAARSLIQTLPEALRAGAQMDLSKKGQRYLGHVAQAARESAADSINAQLLADADQYRSQALNAWRSGNDAAVSEWDMKFRQTVQARTDLSAQQKKSLILRYQDEGRAQAALGAFDGHLAQGPAAARSFINGMFSPGNHGDWDVSERERLAGVMEGRVRDVEIAQQRAAGEAEKATEARRARWRSDFDIRLSRGQVGYEAVEEAYRQGLLKPHERTSAVESIDRLNRDRTEREADFRRVAAILDGTGVPLDAGAKRDRDAVEHHFSVMVNGRMNQLPPEDGRTAIADMSKRYGMVPQQVLATVRTAVHAGDIPAKVAAVDMFDRLTTQNGAFASEFGTDERAFLETASSLVRAGTPSDMAVALASEKVMRAGSAEWQVRRERIRAEGHHDDNTTWLSTQLDDKGKVAEVLSWDFADPQMQDRLAGEFNNTYDLYFQRTGDVEASRAAALKDVRRVWGVTSVGGVKRMQKYAPEAFYGVPQEPNTSWMTDQLLSDLKTSGGLDDRTDWRGKVFLEPHPTAARAVQSGHARPAYLVLYRSSDGTVGTVSGKDGRPLLWQPDYATWKSKQMEAMQAGHDRRGATADIRRQMWIDIASPTTPRY